MPAVRPPAAAGKLTRTVFTHMRGIYQRVGSCAEARRNGDFNGCQFEDWSTIPCGWLHTTGYTMSPLAECVSPTSQANAARRASLCSHDRGWIPIQTLYLSKSPPLLATTCIERLTRKLNLDHSEFSRFDSKFIRYFRLMLTPWPNYSRGC